jgi:cytochrome d ubiquinol oxidase subunit II
MIVIVWFVLVALMLTAYAVLDGFDLGAGVLHLLIARSEDDRRLVLRAIGPVWDGNEVWLIAAGGTLFFAFPRLYASSFSGFYLALNIVLWLLMFRGIGVEFRRHLEAPVWRDFFDGAFGFASTLLALVFGVAMGNVLRGVPLQADGSFFEPLWTNWRVGVNNGILDWYTVLCGVIVLVATTVHGAAYIATKTDGPLHDRARLVVAVGAAPLLLVCLVGLFATIVVRPHSLANYQRHTIGVAIPAAAAASFAALLYFCFRRRDTAMFLGSCAFLALMLGGAAFAVYPDLLPASTGEAYSLTIYNTASGYYPLRYGIYWWAAGILIAIGYFVLVYRMFRGKVRVADWY